MEPVERLLVSVARDADALQAIAKFFVANFAIDEVIGLNEFDSLRRSRGWR